MNGESRPGWAASVGPAEDMQSVPPSTDLAPCTRWCHNVGGEWHRWASEVFGKCPCPSTWPAVTP